MTSRATPTPLNIALANLLVRLSVVLLAIAQVTSEEGAVQTCENAKEMCSDTLSVGQDCCPCEIVRSGPHAPMITPRIGNIVDVSIYANQVSCSSSQPPDNYTWKVYWGDGNFSSSTTTTLELFQASHMYPENSQVIDYYNVQVSCCSSSNQSLCCDCFSDRLART